MPKKLSLYWPEDANRNKLRSKTLRVLRDRPNKLHSNSRAIQPLSDTQNKKNYKGEKIEKLKPIEEFHGFLSSEPLLSQHSNKNKSRLRSPLQSSKNQRTDLVQNFDANSAWKKKYTDAMAVDFDHMYIDCSDPKISFGRNFEYQHLKELNLLHLDLIQQQTEQLISKDKIIKALREENKNLRARLERIDRRVSLSLHRKAALSPISVQTDFSDDVSYSFNVKSQSPKSQGHNLSPAKSPTLRNSQEKSSSIKEIKDETLPDTDNSFSKRDTLRKHSPKQLSPSSPNSRISPRERRAKKDIATNVLDNSLNNNSSIHLQLPASSVSPVSCDRKTRSPTTKRTLNEEESSIKKNKSNETERRERSPLSPTSDEGITNHSLRSRNKSQEEISVQNVSKVSEAIPQSTQPVIPGLHDGSSEQESKTGLINSSLQETEKPKLTKGIETRKVRGEGILTTNESYYLPPYSSVDFLESPIEEEQTQVEIPKWRIKVLTSLYVMEGTENLEDEIFLKRHAKPEQDERRRKRWDLQRMREQRQYEKLRERYEGRNNSNGSGGRNDRSLWPNPESAQSLQIDSSLPVCAFGQPLAQISDSDFVVPWLSGKTPLQVGHTLRRKKR